MDAERFDRWAQGLNSRLSRRSLSGIAAGALASLGLAATVDAKKKKKKKKKKVVLPPVVPPGVNTTCINLGTACGNTAVCQCRLDKASVQTCVNVVVPPNGISEEPCQQNINCGAGQVCDAVESVCVSACAN